MTYDRQQLGGGVRLACKTCGGFKDSQHRGMRVFCGELLGRHGALRRRGMKDVHRGMKLATINNNIAVVDLRDRQKRMVRVQAPTTIAAVRRQIFIVDFLIITFVCAATALLTSQAMGIPEPLIVATGFAALWFGVTIACKSYNLHQVDNFGGIKRLVAGGLVTLGAVAALAYLTGSAAYRPQVLLALAVGVPVLAVARLGWLAYVKNQRATGHTRENVLVVAAEGTRASANAALLRDGRYDLSSSLNPESFDSPHVAAEIADRAVKEKVDSVLLSGCPKLVTPVETSRWIPLSSSAHASWRTVGNEVVVEIDHSHKALAPRVIKRAFDIVASVGLLIFLSPLIIAVAIAIRLESRGPIFFVQPRVGEHGELFPFFKLRSMRPNAHLERASVLGPTDEGILERYLHDDRITRVGKFIRRWSIDELPQLLNVLLGHMSLVGPRPVLEEELHDLPEHGERVHLAKPGLTGLWQISGRKEIRWEDRIDMDLHYVDAFSLGLDAKIMAHTASAVFKGSGAY